MSRILLVEDEEHLAAGLAFNLRNAGYDVEVATAGLPALETMSGQSFDLVLLDVMLPDVSGLEVCKRLRQQGRMEPIVMISARDRTEDAISGIDAGADDYITKPFDLDVLLAKVRGALRRQVWGRAATPPAGKAGNGGPPRSMAFGQWTIDFSTFEARHEDGRVAALSPKELAILQLFGARPGEVICARGVPGRSVGNARVARDQDGRQLHQQATPDPGRPPRQPPPHPLDPRRRLPLRCRSVPGKTKAAGKAGASGRPLPGPEKAVAGRAAPLPPPEGRRRVPKAIPDAEALHAALSRRRGEKGRRPIPAVSKRAAAHARRFSRIAGSDRRAGSRSPAEERDDRRAKVDSPPEKGTIACRESRFPAGERDDRRAKSIPRRREDDRRAAVDSPPGCGLGHLAVDSRRGKGRSVRNGRFPRRRKGRSPAASICRRARTAQLRAARTP